MIVQLAKQCLDVGLCNQVVPNYISKETMFEIPLHLLDHTVQPRSWTTAKLPSWVVIINHVVNTDHSRRHDRHHHHRHAWRHRQRSSPVVETGVVPCHFSLQNRWVLAMEVGSFALQLDSLAWDSRVERDLKQPSELLAMDHVTVLHSEKKMVLHNVFV